MSATGKPNRLINESSPYLLQHAHNPVDWWPWNDEALQKARDEDKPILVSIGYSACHWCHVMERECFEEEGIAKIMNERFICIKVDREERPDVDQVYMDAVHMMGVQGGWPLNVFLTSDQKPFYGGTYFPPQNWQQLLVQVSNAYQQQRKQLEESADKFVDALNESELTKYKLNQPLKDFTKEALVSIYNKFAEQYDTKKGGMRRAPKFPMPSNWQFALKYYAISHDQAALDQVVVTLREMAHGGIYDQIGGGFARYSVDARWFAPHFEKMLYDNGQLLSLYSEAYSAINEDLFRKVVFQTISFLEREMLDPTGGFYAALDADSEGEEGKYYVWDAFEFGNVLSQSLKDEEKVGLVDSYYNVREDGNWEERKNILYKEQSLEEFAVRNGMDVEEFSKLIELANNALLDYRSKRIRPGLDDKLLAGWNGLALKGLVDSYRVFEEAHFRELALKNAAFIRDYLVRDGALLRNYKPGAATVAGVLEDYALVIQGLLELYQVVFDEDWLKLADELTSYAILNFYDANEKLFYYTDKSTTSLIARKKEILDNVIPSSNSVMAYNLYVLGHLLGNDKYIEMSMDMMKQVGQLLISDPQFLSNWAGLYTLLVKPTVEIAIIGKDAEFFRTALEKRYMPNKIIAGTESSSDLPLLQNRQAINNKTTIYVCYNKTCQLPVDNVDAAVKQMVEGMR
jgi:uncharacterized protein